MSLRLDGRTSMRARPVASIFLSASAISGLAYAQQVPSPPVIETAPIVVEVTRNREEQITSFIKELTPAPIRGQLSRFEAPVCPKVDGLSDQQAKTIEDRIRLVAAAVGVPLAGTKCIPNLVIFVTDDKPDLMHKLARYPGMFPEEWSGAAIRSFERDPSPVAAWQTETEVWQDGPEITGNEMVAPVTAMAPPPPGGKPGSTSGHTFTSSHAIATRLKPSARHTFSKAVLVVTFQALTGFTPTQLADYAAMRTFIRTDPRQLGTSGRKTILSMFDAQMGATVPLTLTEWDFSFLKAFYSSTTNNYAEHQRAQMKGLMERELDRAQTAQK